MAKRRRYMAACVSLFWDSYKRGLPGLEQHGYGAWMPEPFGQLLKRHLTAVGLSQAALGRATGISQVHVNQVANDKRTPPLEALSAWADTLSLKGPERERFILAGQLAHAPEAVRAHVAKIEAELDRLKSRK